MRKSETKVFVNTNVLVYAFTDDEPDKHERVLNALENCIPVVSTQVLKELSNVLVKKKSVSIDAIVETLRDIAEVSEIAEEGFDLICHALESHAKYGYSFYDCLIIETALAAGCSVLLSEDLQDGQIIRDKLKITNPFK